MNDVPPELLIRNARTTSSSELVDVAVRAGRFITVGGNPPQLTPSTRVIDVGGRLVCPPFTDAHMHLDSALTCGRPRHNRSGDLQEGIEIWAERRATLTENEVHANGSLVMNWMAAHGIGHLRCHVDVSDPDFIALRALMRLREQSRDVCTIELVAFPQDGVFTHRDGKRILTRAVELGCDAVGGAPHLENSRDDGLAAVRHAFDLAQEHGIAVDLHCDETDDPHSRQLEIIIAETEKRDWGGRVCASHCTAMAAYHPGYRGQLARRAAAIGVGLTLSPMVNALLQGHHDSNPRRGLAPLKELQAAGVCLGIGHDSILDPWCSLGSGNMLQLLQTTAVLAHMATPDELTTLLEIATRSAATLVRTPGYGIRPGNPASFVILDSPTAQEAVRLARAPRYVFRNGTETYRTEPQMTTLKAVTPGAPPVRFEDPSHTLGALVDSADGRGGST
ncbi:amidohydrolase family protein [Streptomyces sp. NPDC050658]|uniref:amidohydrolase family protein n=1 Tax=unclassified Streptomyces TaxID=2593676 RepID=UPI00342DAF7C